MRDSLCAAENRGNAQDACTAAQVQHVLVVNVLKALGRGEDPRLSTVRCIDGETYMREARCAEVTYCSSSRLGAANPSKGCSSPSSSLSRIVERVEARERDRD